MCVHTGGAAGACLSLGAQNMVQAHRKDGLHGFEWELNWFNWLKVQNKKLLCPMGAKNQRRRIRGGSERNSLIHVGQRAERNCGDWRGEEPGLPW